MRITVVQDAPQGSRFTTDVFDADLNRDLDVHLPDGTRFTGRLVEAEVSADGLSARMTLDIDLGDDTEPGEPLPVSAQDPGDR